MESVADFKLLAKWTRLDRFPEWKENVAKIGLLILIVALAVEVVAAINSHNVSQQIIAGLNDEMRETQDREQALIGLTGDLRKRNTALEGKFSEQENTLQLLGDRNKYFEKAATAQRKRYEKALAAINSEEINLNKVLSDAKNSASIAASAADIASKTAANMNVTLNAQKGMQERLYAALTPRDLSPMQLMDISERLKPLGKVPFVLSLTNDPETLELTKKISEALEASGWDWRPWATSDNALTMGLTFRSKPFMSTVTLRGIRIEVANADLLTLNRSVFELEDALSSAGLFVQIRVLSDEDVKAEKTLLGVIHVEVGSKP